VKLNTGGNFRYIFANLAEELQDDLCGSSLERSRQILARWTTNLTIYYIRGVT